jgi:hypothetical protein
VLFRSTVVIAGGAFLGSTYLAIGLLYCVAWLSVSAWLLAPAVGLVVLAIILYASTRFAMRSLLLRMSGRVRLVLEESTVTMETIVWGVVRVDRKCFDAPVRLVTLAVRGDEALATVDAHAVRSEIVPLAIEDVRYLATLLDARSVAPDTAG